MSQNVSQEKRRGLKKIQDGTLQSVEKGNFSLVIFCLRDGGQLQMFGEELACKMIDDSVKQKLNQILLKSKRQKVGDMKFFDSANSKSDEISQNASHLPLLPNSIDSEFLPK